MNTYKYCFPDFHSIFWACIAMMTLMLAIPFYALLRPCNTPLGSLSHGIVSFFASEQTLIYFQQQISPRIPIIIKDTSPNFLWCFSLTLFLCLTWKDELSSKSKSANCMLWIFSPIILCLFWEFAQYSHFVGGQGTLSDWIAGCFATVLAWLLFKTGIKQDKIEPLFSKGVS